MYFFQISKYATGWGAATQTFAPGGKYPRAATGCMHVYVWWHWQAEYESERKKNADMGSFIQSEMERINHQ